MEFTSCGSGALGPLGFLVCCTIFTGSLLSLTDGSSSTSTSSCGCGSISEYKSGNLGISKRKKEINNRNYKRTYYYAQLVHSIPCNEN